MPEKPGLVSVIIPAYNAAVFIRDTIQSVLDQTYTNWEMLVVNDGSTDQTAAICGEFTDTRIKLIQQHNTGVARARNNGLARSAGEYVVFLDADDIMTPEFLAARVEVLHKQETFGFVGGMIELFPDKTEIKSAATDPVNQILFFNSSTGTAPSAYMFKKAVLTRHHIMFNPVLQSSADRFFILEVAKHSRGYLVSSGRGKLLYRFTSDSMSNLVSPKLIIDNEKFYYELKKKNLLPEKRLNLFKSLYFLSLAKGFSMVHQWKRAVIYSGKSFINHPLYFLESIGRFFFRHSSPTLFTQV
jgi:glycosyltransferase involved in cell wall biosynthesis